MTFAQSISLILIRLFIHPGGNKKRAQFKKQLYEAKSILIALPSPDLTLKYQDLIHSAVRLFNRKKPIILMPVSDSAADIDEIKKKIYKVIYPHPHQSDTLFKLRRSELAGRLKQQRFDLLLDLDPEPSLVNIYLSRLLNPGLRITISKPHTDSFYNLQFGRTNMLYEEQLQGLYTFLLNMFESR